MALIDIHLPPEFHLHLHGDLSSLVAAMDRQTVVLQEGFALMADRAQALTTAVNDVAARVDTTVSTLTTEIQQINDKLNNADDASLRQAADEAVTRLQTVAQNLDTMNATIQGIVQDAPTEPTP